MDKLIADYRQEVKKIDEDWKRCFITYKAMTKDFAEYNLYARRECIKEIDYIVFNSDIWQSNEGPVERSGITWRRRRLQSLKAEVERVKKLDLNPFITLLRSKIC